MLLLRRSRLLLGGFVLVSSLAQPATAQDRRWPTRDTAASRRYAGALGWPSQAASGLQLDITGILEAPPEPEPPPPPRRPMFSPGWTRDGFGGRPQGWR